MPVAKAGTLAYLKSEPFQCPECGAPFDCWEIVLDAIQAQSFRSKVYEALGAREVGFYIYVAAGEEKWVPLESHGLPKDGRLLCWEWTGWKGDVEAVEVRPNFSPRHSAHRERALHFYGKGTGEDPDPPPARVDVFYSWVPHAAEDQGWQNLVDACESYSAGRFSSAIVHANTAVEVRVTRIVEALLAEAPKDRVSRRSLRSSKSFDRLDVLLSALARLATPLLGQVRARLNKLRAIRNDIVHDGRPRHDLMRTEIGELLCAAVLGFRYCQLLEHELWRARGKPAPTNESDTL